MKQLIRMITPFIAMLFLVACGGSSDNIINDIVDDLIDNPKFTSDILVGKTYTTTEEGIVTTVTFTETQVTVEEDGESFILSYSINEDGVLVVDGDDLHTLISIDENGDLHVENDGVEDVWVLADGITDTPVTPEELACEIDSNYSPEDPVLYQSSSPIATVIALHGKTASPESEWMNELAIGLSESEYDVILPYMPWSNLVWDASVCESYNYISTLIRTEMAKGKEVILLGHSLAGVAVSGYMALSEVTKPTATVILAPGHLLSPGITNDQINRANELIANGDGDVYTDFSTGYLYGTTKTISSTPRIYLSYHTTTTSIDMELFPNLNLTIPGVQTQKEVLWLAGIDDYLTDIAKNRGFIDLVENNPNYIYDEIEGDHHTMMVNVTDPLDVWYKN